MTIPKRPISRAPRRPDTQVVVIRLQRDEVKQADEYSAQEDRSRASFIRQMFQLGVKSYEHEKGFSR